MLQRNMTWLHSTVELEATRAVQALRPMHTDDIVW
jgi:hypothetical protein